MEHTRKVAEGQGDGTPEADFHVIAVREVVDNPLEARLRVYNLQNDSEAAGKRRETAVTTWAHRTHSTKFAVSMQTGRSGHGASNSEAHHPLAAVTTFPIVALQSLPWPGSMGSCAAERASQARGNSAASWGQGDWGQGETAGS